MIGIRIFAEVEARASQRCEYCRMHQSLPGATFHIEHIIPLSQGGMTELTNLALACPGCNLKKSDRVALIDPVTQSVIRLFDPRRDSWADHFRWDDFRIVAQTSIGRAVIAAFDLNHPRRLQIRQMERLLGLF